ncbi:hypothetical protein EMCG_03248 [[Emmonsia] crescens]|uniref:Uncharacterized protein n=1 Tax=[Emmonsia] crescens TaxID=73230 RepID=A0A0G2J8J9_9EURO|nr:hypothetical protein EMCG_03248 [Emmonsia crescens UAMH 3008]
MPRSPTTTSTKAWPVTATETPPAASVSSTNSASPESPSTTSTTTAPRAPQALPWRGRWSGMVLRTAYLLLALRR